MFFTSSQGETDFARTKCSILEATCFVKGDNEQQHQQHNSTDNVNNDNLSDSSNNDSNDSNKRATAIASATSKHNNRSSSRIPIRAKQQHKNNTVFWGSQVLICLYIFCMQQKVGFDVLVVPSGILGMLEGHHFGRRRAARRTKSEAVRSDGFNQRVAIGG